MPDPRPLPPELTDWVSARNPGLKAQFKKAEYVLSDAWNGTVWLFHLYNPNIVPREATKRKGWAFALNQFDDQPNWCWHFEGPESKNAKEAVHRELRNR